MLGSKASSNDGLKRFSMAGLLPSSLSRIFVVALIVNFVFVLVLNVEVEMQPTASDFITNSKRSGLLIPRERFEQLTRSTVYPEYEERLQKMEKTLERNLKATIVSCRFNTKSGKYSSLNADCESPPSGARIVIYNPFHSPRIYCGHTIAANDVKYLDYDCTENWPFSRLNEVMPSYENREHFPIKVGREASTSSGTAFRRFKECDINCACTAHGGINFIKDVVGTDWRITFSMEGPAYYSSLAIEPAAHHHGKFYSTTSFRSEIPAPYFSWAEYNIQTPAVDYDKAIKGAVFIARNCGSRNNREKVVKDLIAYPHLRVDSVSKCLHNAEKPIPGDNKVELMQQYLFYLAFENQCYDDYVTEKMWGALQSGVLPVYYGAPNIDEHIPPNSVINAHSFDSHEALGAYLVQVANNKTLYEWHQAWRKEPLPQSFVQKYNFTHVHSNCRTCRWAFAKMYGLNWNHESQSIQKQSIARKVCFGADGLLTHPIRESWISDVFEDPSSFSANQHAASSCHVDVTTSAVALAAGRLQRTIVFRDGVTDFFLQPTGTNDPRDVILNMEVPIDASSFSVFDQKGKNQHLYMLQDATSRMSIVTPAPTLQIDFPEKGTIRMRIKPTMTPLRFRLITEDVNNFYDGDPNQPTYFAELMAEDFSKPLEKFFSTQAKQE